VADSAGFDERPARWDELDLVGHWRGFLRDPGSYFRHWLEG
jgi:hypothetical protein